jgi:acyl-coenzyme A thioesterase PaaI-like protein
MVVAVTFAHFDEQIADQLLRSPNTAGGLSRFLSFRHIELAAGRLVAEMETRAELLTPFGTLHGGCLSAMVDHCPESCSTPSFRPDHGSPPPNSS